MRSHGGPHGGSAGYKSPAYIFLGEKPRIDRFILSVGGSRYTRRGKRMIISGSYGTQIDCDGSSMLER
jgi:hypothetical protein